MIRRLIILLLIVGCEEDTVAPEPSLCDGLTEVELWGEVYDIATTDTLILQNQELADSIPPEIGCLTNLTSLHLSYNQLTGEIPQEVCDLIEKRGMGRAYDIWGEMGIGSPYKVYLGSTIRRYL